KRPDFSRFVCAAVRFLGMLFPPLKSAIELEELGECRSDDFAIGRLVAAHRLDIADVITQLFELSHVDFALQGLESLHGDDRIVGIRESVCPSAHSSSSSLSITVADARCRYRSFFLTVSSARPSLLATACLSEYWAIAVSMAASFTRFTKDVMLSPG